MVCRESQGIRYFLSQYNFFHHTTVIGGAEPSPCQAPACCKAAVIWDCGSTPFVHTVLRFASVFLQDGKKGLFPR